jgi:protein gp37
MGRTSIEWTDESWNPTTGCSRVSPGCEHCYAEALSLRRGWSKKPWTGPNAVENVRLHPDRLDQPLRWKKPRRVFVNSMSDLFHEQVPDSFIDQVFAVMADARVHTFQVLTKRPVRMRGYLVGADRWRRIAYEYACRTLARGKRPAGDPREHVPWPLPNVWLGVSVEDQRRADERIPLLLSTPAAIRFVSAEPLLGPVDIRAYIAQPVPYDPYHEQRLNWLIVGGESGPGARAMDVAWARASVRQCREAGVACFVKQLGSAPGFRLEDEEACGNIAPSFHHYDREAQLYVKRLTDRKGGDPAEWPADLRVREWPS